MRLNSILCSIAILTLTACGQAIPTSGGGADAPDSFKSQLGGFWKGQMTNKTVDVGSALRDQTAEAEFNFKSDSEGTFEIKLSSLEDAKVEGTFVDFAGKSLHLTIKSSTVSTIGVKGATTVVNYLLIGSNLELTNDRIDLQLIKTKANSSNDTDELEQPSDTLMGQWRCTDEAERTWDFKIANETDFTADIANQNGVSVWIAGKLVADQKRESTSLATVTTSADSKNVGMRLKLQLTSNNEMQVERYESKDANVDTVADLFLCKRQ